MFIFNFDVFVDKVYQCWEKNVSNSFQTNTFNICCALGLEFGFISKQFVNVFCKWWGQFDGIVGFNFPFTPSIATLIEF